MGLVEFTFCGPTQPVLLDAWHGKDGCLGDLYRAPLRHGSITAHPRLGPRRAAKGSVIAVWTSRVELYEFALRLTGPSPSSLSWPTSPDSIVRLGRENEVQVCLVGIRGIMLLGRLYPGSDT